MNLFEGIDAAVQADPDRRALIWVGEDGARETLTAGELQREAIACARGMRTAGLRPNDVVLLALKHDRDLVPLFLAGAYGAAVPSILSYLSSRADPAVYAERVARVAEQSGARAVICAPEAHAALAERLASSDCLAIASTQLERDRSGGPWHSGATPETIAAIQFTSGTTGSQKGVCISHRAFREYLDVYTGVVSMTANDVAVGWLPLYHDMGLISSILLPLFNRVPAIVMSPSYWLRAPIVLLRAVTEFRGTMVWLPNFAFNLMGQAIREADLHEIDLSSWRFCGSGGEVLRRDSLEAFCRRFERYGFRRQVIRVGYGMAENVLGATITPTFPEVDWVNIAELQRQRKAVPAAPQSPNATAIVCNGPPMPGTEFAIVAEDGSRLSDRNVGEILVRSRHMFSGYHRRPDLTQAAMVDGWFRSGDLGYTANGELYICGRKKDLIIVGGHNICPEDIEAIADRVEGIQSGRAVAFGVPDEDIGTERIVVVCELSEPPPEGGTRAIDRGLRRAVMQELDVAVGTIHFAPRGWIIKTTSGKHARAANRDKYLAEITGESK